MVFIGILAKLAGKTVSKGHQDKLISSARDFVGLYCRNPSAGAG